MSFETENGKYIERSTLDTGILERTWLDELIRNTRNRQIKGQQYQPLHRIQESTCNKTIKRAIEITKYP